MFIYLSKKIAIPNGVKLKCVAWNPEHGWIACGGDSGLLKVLKLESANSKDSKTKGVAAPSNLSMNQTLEGHNKSVMCVTWNANYRKLTTSDQNGLIIVWMLHKGMWFEEMINNRNKSVVRDMKWTADGQKICIVYEDGAVIVGSVDGNRLWGKELNVTLAFVEWSPDGRNILFVTLSGDVLLYDSLGNRLSKVPIYAIDENSSQEVKVVGLHWYDGAEGHVDPNAPTLAVAFENGRVQITRGEDDQRPVLIDTGMRLSQCKWNTDGSVLALAGTQTTKLPSGETRDVSMVQFYTPHGKHLRTLKVPGSGINSLSWEGGGLRIALAVDAYIYFANIRPDYRWGFFSNTLVYAFNKPDRQELGVVFWDTHTDEKYTKYVKKLQSIRAAGDNCILTTQSDDASPGTGGDQFILILCNAIGSPVDSKYVDITPHHVSMTKNHVIVASDDVVYVWQYRTAVSKLTTSESSSSDSTATLRRREGRERMFHIDDMPNVQPSDVDAYRHREAITSDLICAVCASDKYLIVARESGTIYRFTLPHIALEHKYVVRCRPQLVALNCTSTRLSIIDINGMLTFFDLDTVKSGGGGDDLTPSHEKDMGEHLSFERKDSWDMIWAEDNPELFAMMEKTRMYIFRGLDPEEPALSSGYLCQYKDLQIKAVLLDELMANPEQPDKDMVLNFETKSLRDARELLGNVGIRDAYQYIEDHPHPRLWRLLAEAALEELELAVADKAFVRCGDYQGIQYVKRLRLLNDRMKQKAEVAAYFQRFDEAESLYREIDRKDLAIELRMRLGDWFRVVQLLQSGGGDDQLLSLAWNKIGDYYADRQKWSKAVQYYAQAKNNEALIECYYTLEDYTGLERLISAIPEGSSLLADIGRKFESVGICTHAVSAFLRGGEVKRAIDSCVLLNQWSRAVELAEEHKFSQIEGLLTKYGAHLLEKGKELAAIELYRKANKATEAAKLLAALGAKVGATKVQPVRAKKLYVLAALEVERYNKRMLSQQTTSYGAANTTAQTLENLMTHDRATGQSRLLDNAWRGAEAYHFLLLAHQQLYQGQIEPAMKTSLRLAEYEDVVDPVDIYSLIALTTFYNKFFLQCSNAFIKLESLPSLSAEEKEKYSDLALAIFIKNPPSDPSRRSMSCPSSDCSASVKDWYTSCPECNLSFPGCVKTGRALLDTRYYMCRVCRHRSVEQELRGVNNCPLCHSVLL